MMTLDSGGDTMSYLKNCWEDKLPGGTRQEPYRYRGAHLNTPLFLTIKTAKTSDAYDTLGNFDRRGIPYKSKSIEAMIMRLVSLSLGVGIWKAYSKCLGDRRNTLRLNMSSNRLQIEGFGWLVRCTGRFGDLGHHLPTQLH